MVQIREKTITVEYNQNVCDKCSTDVDNLYVTNQGNVCSSCFSLINGFTIDGETVSD